MVIKPKKNRKRETIRQTCLLQSLPVSNTHKKKRKKIQTFNNLLLSTRKPYS